MRLLTACLMLAVFAVGFALEPIRQPDGPFTVVDVIDGDTIRIRASGGTETVRLIGIDTPETVAPGRPVEAYGSAASSYMGSLVGGRQVWLEIGVGSRDQYGRLLAYVYLEDPAGEWQFDGRRFIQVNRQLALAGLADLMTISPNVQYADLYLNAVQEAREARRGMWSNLREVEIPFAPFGPDRNCGDFDSWDEAQAFYEAAGGPDTDEHRLDADRDGYACEGLPGFPY